MLSSPPLALGVPAELVEAIASRTATILAEQLPAAPEPYLDVDAAADYLACSRDRVYDLRRQGLPHFKDGTRLLFRRDDLDAWLAPATDQDSRNRTAAAVSPPPPISPGPAKSPPEG